MDTAAVPLCGTAALWGPCALRVSKYSHPNPSHPPTRTHALSLRRGWGNGENQTYTNSEANVQVANGSLAITALRSRTGAWTRCVVWPCFRGQ